MVQKRLFWILAVTLFAVVSTGTAQEMTPTLRELAARNNLFIGAAIFTPYLNDPGYVETFTREFNMLTPENDAKACSVQPQLGRFDFRNFDGLVALAEEHEMEVHGHTLLWHQCVPGWLANGEFTRDEAIGHMRDHIYTVVGRYKGRVAIWDVVNEGIDDSGQIRDTPWHRLIGDDYIELAFRFAHEADPDALLFYNDWGAEGMNPKGNAVYEMVAGLVERGVPIHGVGLQMHLEIGATEQHQYVSPENLSANMERLGALGLQVQITELDVRYNGDGTDAIFQRQAADYYRLMQTCLDNDNCTAFIVWGVTDRLSWLRQASFVNNPTVEPLLFDSRYEPKPAYFAVLDALARAADADPILSDEEREAILGTD